MRGLISALALAGLLAGCAAYDNRVRGGGAGLPEVAASARTDQIVPAQFRRLAAAWMRISASPEASSEISSSMQ